MVEGTQAQAAGRSIRELERLRDDYLVRSSRCCASTTSAPARRCARSKRGCTRTAAKASALPRRDTASAAADCEARRAPRVDRLQRSHDRLALPAGVRRRHGCAVSPRRRRRGLPCRGAHVLHGRERTRRTTRKRGSASAFEVTTRVLSLDRQAPARLSSTVPHERSTLRRDGRADARARRYGDASKAAPIAQPQCATRLEQLQAAHADDSWPAASGRHVGQTRVQ